MNVTQLKRVRRLFNVDYMPVEINRANQRKWVQAIRMLGDKWVLSPASQKEIK